MNSQSQTIPQQHVVDPITLEVIRRGIVSITDQIDANISRTAFSPYIYEYKDFAVGLVGADGESRSELSLHEDSAGAGKFRGGLGFRKRYQILGPCDLQAMFDRMKYPP